MRIREHLVPRGSKRRRGAKLKAADGVTIHNTGNNDRGANADRNAKYQANSCNDAVNGWHWTVDEAEAVLSIPEDEIAEHTGKRQGNDTTVGIEICDNCDGNILAATDNAAKLAAMVLRRQGFENAVWKKNIFQHNDWSGKDCPQEIRAGRPFGWDEFLRRVNGYIAVYAGASPGLAMAALAEQPAVFARTLRYTPGFPCMRGADVAAVQRRLMALGYNLGAFGADGAYGAATQNAVRQYKAALANGDCDKYTWDSLMGGD